MKFVCFAVAALCLISVSEAQNTVTIESLDSNGKLRFGKVLSASSYRVEWAPSVDGPWTNFAAAAASLDSIVSPGLGTQTSTIPIIYRVIATVTGIPPGMVLVPEGNFAMGNSTNVFLAAEGGSDERPQHVVYVSAYFMDQYEVTKSLWDSVQTYNGGNGYSYSNAVGARATNHPVHTVSWYDAIKWCNARSEMEGLTPVYYTNASLTSIYRAGDVTPFVNWSANGYRLPTEAEWEKAARGGSANLRFPWTDYTNKISWARANYYGWSQNYSYDLSGDGGAYHPTFTVGGAYPYLSSPVGYFPANTYGLYDMAGNHWEWCWDWYDSSYYSSSPTSNPRGPDGPLTSGILRGGSSLSAASNARVADRLAISRDVAGADIGFRCVRGL